MATVEQVEALAAEADELITSAEAKVAELRAAKSDVPQQMLDSLKSATNEFFAGSIQLERALEQSPPNQADLDLAFASFGGARAVGFNLRTQIADLGQVVTPFVKSAMGKGLLVFGAFAVLAAGFVVIGNFRK